MTGPVARWTRPVAGRRGGARSATAGFVLVGGSGFLLLAAGPRLLGPDAFSGLGLVWTVSTLFGVGFATPTEQVLTRRLNAGRGDLVRRPLAVLLAGTAAAVVACLLGVPLLPSTGALPGSAVGAALAVTGWGVVAFVRGRLAGSGDVVAYSWVLATEAGVRVALVLAAWVVPSAATVLLLCAVGLPLLVASGVGLLWRHASEAPSSAPVVANEHAAFVLMALGYQATLNLATLVVDARFGALEPAVTGQFVAASSYLRVPLLLTGGIGTSALVALSAAWALGDRAGFDGTRRRAVRQVLLLCSLTTTVLLLAAPWALPLYYGDPLELPSLVLVGLAVSTVVAGLGAILTVPPMAAGRPKVVAAVWLVAAVVTTAGLLVSPSIGTGVAAALVLGPALAAITLGLFDRRLHPSPGTA